MTTLIQYSVRTRRLDTFAYVILLLRVGNMFISMEMNPLNPTYSLLSQFTVYTEIIKFFPSVLV